MASLRERLTNAQFVTLKSEDWNNGKKKKKKQKKKNQTFDNDDKRVIVKDEEKIMKELKNINTKLSIIGVENYMMQTLYILNPLSLDNRSDIEKMIKEKLGNQKYELIQGRARIRTSSSSSLKLKRKTLCIRRKAFLSLTRPIYFSILIILLCIFLITICSILLYLINR
jgi:hypothetical protein